MASYIARRKFLATLGGAAAAGPLAARAQRAYRLGILTGRGREEPNFVAFFDELRQFGIVEGQHLTVDPLGFEVREDQFPALANELVASGVNVILAAGDPAITAAQAATRSTPVLGVSGDMVGGWAGAFARAPQRQHHRDQHPRNRAQREAPGASYGGV